MFTSKVYSMGKSKKCEIEKTDRLFTPGPGAYDQNSSTKKSNPTWKMGTSKRTGLYNTTSTPGPGSYGNDSFLGKAPKYSFAGKSSYDYSKLKCSPGPGNYNPKWDQQLKSSSCYSIGFRPKSADSRLKVPGPGAYDLRSSLEKPSYKFGHEKRVPSTNGGEFPGPGSYVVANELGTNSAMKSGSAHYSFGKEKRDKTTHSEMPGPGNYEIKPIIGNEGKKISISGFRPDFAMNSATMCPGPGSYDVSMKNKPKTPSYRIGSAKRDADPIQREKNSMPAPNNYNPKLFDKNSNPQFSFGTSSRPPLNQDEKNPGPGSYSTENLIGKNAPKFTIRPKTAYVGDNLKTPGPGTYDNNNFGSVRPKSPNWRMGTAKKDDIYRELSRKGVPGPGNYELKSSVGSSGPKYKFGNEKRENKVNESVPGPGQYRIPCSFGGVASYNTVGGGFYNQQQYKFI